MYIRTSSFVSLETTFSIACIQQGFVDPIMQHGCMDTPDPYPMETLPPERNMGPGTRMGPGIRDTLPPMNRLTDTCENIAFLQLLLWAVMSNTFVSKKYCTFIFYIGES